MHQRATNRARESVSPEVEDASYYTDDRSDDKESASDNASAHHLLSMVFLSAMLICTFFFLRYDNIQIGIAARAIGDLEKIIKDQELGRELKETRIAKSQQEVSDCKTSPDRDIAKLKLKVEELERRIRGAAEDLNRLTAEKDTLSTEQTELKAILELKLQQKAENDKAMKREAKRNAMSKV